MNKKNNGRRQNKSQHNAEKNKALGKDKQLNKLKKKYNQQLDLNFLKIYDIMYYIRGCEVDLFIFISQNMNIKAVHLKECNIKKKRVYL